MRDDANDEQNIYDGIRMEDKGPIWFLFFGHQKESRYEFNSEEKDEQKPAEAMENPNKH